jgi:hypothetical protein
MEEMTVEIKKSMYDYLIERSEWLDCLEAAGVDNWDGIDMAYEMYKTEEN